MSGGEYLIMINLANFTASDLRRAASIKDEIETLQAQLNKSLGGYVGNGLIATRQPRKAGRKLGKTSGKKTVADCVVAALGSETLPIKKIIIRASQIRGKAISPALLGFTLAQMKKAKQIVNPARGHYRKA